MQGVLSSGSLEVYDDIAPVFLNYECSERIILSVMPIGLKHPIIRKLVSDHLIL